MSEKEKRKSVKTATRLKEHVNGAGILCLTMRQEDYISIGSSTFIGIRRVNGKQVAIGIVSPPDEKIQRFEFGVNSIRGDE